MCLSVIIDLVSQSCNDIEKICTRFGFFVRESSSDPLSPSGILKIPRATRRALGPPLRPPFVASLLSPASAQALGPSGVPEKFQFIFLSGFMKPPKVSIFAPKNIRETPENIKKINETRSQKKNAWFPINEFELYYDTIEISYK